MPWSTTMAMYVAAGTAPPDATTGSIVGYVLNYGILGIIALAFAWLFYKGWRLIPPDREAAGREAARAEARADLLEERARVLAEKTRIEAERDEAQQFVRAQMIPLLLNFTNATGALLPILQDIVRRRDEQSNASDRRGR